MRVLLLILAFLLLPLPLAAKPLIADISDYVIAIDSSFTGGKLLLFGAQNDPGELLVAVRGPRRNVVVRKKERIAGIWMNTEQAHFRDLPYFYAFTGTKPLADLTSSPLYGGLALGMRQIDFAGSTATPLTPEEAQRNRDFAQAFLETQQRQKLYREYARPVRFMGATLFKTEIDFPDNLPRGDYAVDIYLFEDGLLRGMQTLPIYVNKVGFDAFIYDSAHRHPLPYGIAAVLIAVLAGWSVSLLFNKLW